MRKIILFILFITLLLTGCNKNQESIKQINLTMSEGQVLVKNHYTRAHQMILKLLLKQVIISIM